ncbi:MAG: 2-dehydropantoate 2-reductase [candidate division NC10 bacterium]|nr:2-dehydropantoate 2-reductase [candidate division NC10 bacterium]
MRIAMLGAGAMGGVFGSLLVKAGFDVVFLDIWREHIEKMQKEGLRVRDASGEQLIPVKAFSSPEGLGPVDLVFVMVKAYDTETALQQWRVLFSEKTLVLTMQNGLGNVERIARHLPIDRIIPGVTSRGAYVIGPGAVNNSGHAETVLGVVHPSQKKDSERLAQMFTQAGVEVKYDEDLQSLVWGKLIMNLAINPVGALTGMRNIEAVSYPPTLRIQEMAMREGMAVGKAKGIQFRYSDPVKKLKEIVSGAPQNRCSMLQDIDRRKRTEIDYINGAVVELGRELNIPTPVNEALTCLVKGKESLYLENKAQT